MATQALVKAVEPTQLIISAIVAFLAAVLVQRFLSRDPLSTFPLAGAAFGNAGKRRKAYSANAKSIYTEGYEKFKNKVFRITSPHTNNVVLPHSFLPELSKLPDDVISVSEAITKQLEGKFTNIDVEGAQPTVVHTIKTTLTPALGRINHAIADEVDRTLRSELPPCKDWTEVNINSKLLRTVAIVSGRVFVGPELCRDEAYIGAAVNYTIDLMQARQAIQNCNPLTKWFKAPRLPEIQKLNKHEEEVMKILRPVVTARRRAEKEEPGYQKPDDMLQWVLDTKGLGDTQDRELAKIQLLISFAAIHTTTVTATNVFYNLAVNPELVQELREEIQTVLGNHNNEFSPVAMQNMKKLDSVIKESMRLHPLGMSTFFRKVLKPFTLSNGQTIPAGVMIEVPGYHVAHDPEIFPDPYKFDGLRFHRLREQAESFNKPKVAGGKTSAVESAAHNLFVSVSPNSLLFGYGRHACPGRFFAANEIKMIVARAVLTYDMRNAGDSQERYNQWYIGDSCIPDPMKNLEFKAV